MMQQPSPPTNQFFLSSLFFSALSSPIDNIPCSLSGNVVEIHDELSPQSQNTVSIIFTLDQTCGAFFGMGDVSETHCEDWAFVSTPKL